MGEYGWPLRVVIVIIEHVLLYIRMMGIALHHLAYDWFAAPENQEGVPPRFTTEDRWLLIITLLVILILWFVPEYLFRRAEK